MRQYIVQTLRGTQWESNGLGENAPRASAECAEFIAWATSPACDWTRDGGAPHRYRIAEVEVSEDCEPGEHAGVTWIDHASERTDYNAEMGARD